MTFSIGVIESDTVSTSNMPQLPLCKNFKIQSKLLFCKVSFQNFKIVTALREFQNSESTSFLTGKFCPKVAQLEDGYDLFVQDGEVLPSLFNYDHL